MGYPGYKIGNHVVIDRDAYQEASLAIEQVQAMWQLADELDKKPGLEMFAPTIADIIRNWLARMPLGLEMEPL